MNPRVAPLQVRVPSRAPILDPGLSPEDLQAIRRALTVETNPNHLVGMAASLSPAYPVAASLLYARSRLLELRTRANQDAIVDDGRRALESLQRQITKRSAGRWPGDVAARWIASPIDARENLSRATDLATTGAWPDVSRAWGGCCPQPVPWPRLERMKAALIGARATGNDAETGMALVLPVVGKALLHFPHAAHLQSLGFHELYPKTVGKTVGARAADLIGAAKYAQGHALADVLVLRRRRTLEQAALQNKRPIADLQDGVRRLASSWIVDPAGSTEGYLPEIADLARCMVEEVGPGIRIICPRSAWLAFGGAPSRRLENPERDRWNEWHRRAAKI